MLAMSLTRVVSVGDTPVLLEASDAHREMAMAALLRGLPTASTRPSCSLRFVAQAPGGVEGKPQERYDDLRVWHLGDDVAYAHPCGVRARLNDEGAWIGGPVDAWFGGAAGDPAPVFRRFLPLGLARLLSVRSQFLLHAGAIARDGAALLVMGPPASGKSTLGLAALRAGWTLLGDGLTIVRVSGGRLEVSGVPKPPAVPLDVLDGAPAGATEIAGDARGRWELDPAILWRGWLPLAGVLLPGHSRSPQGELRSAPAAAVFPLAVGSFPLATHPASRRRYYRHAAAISRLPARELLHGAEAATRLAAAAELISCTGSVAGPP